MFSARTERFESHQIPTKPRHRRPDSSVCTMPPSADEGLFLCQTYRLRKNSSRVHHASRCTFLSLSLGFVLSPRLVASFGNWRLTCFYIYESASRLVD